MRGGAGECEEMNESSTLARSRIESVYEAQLFIHLEAIQTFFVSLPILVALFE